MDNENKPINWEFLNRVMDYHRANGYTPVEVPWLVERATVDLTYTGPLNAALQGLYLVGSGEQGFLELERKGKMPRGKFVTMTPCFRDEPQVDEYHQLHFQKVELYQNVNVSYQAAWEMMEDAYDGMRTLMGSREFNIIDTDAGFDLMLHGVEVGSYGIREVDGIAWVYGTALAEPRFSTVLRNHGF